MHILDELKQNKVLLSDGAWGTLLQAKGMKPGECPELWNITHRSEVFEIAESYLKAGSDIIGGCCGTTPAHIREMAKVIGR